MSILIRQYQDSILSATITQDQHKCTGMRFETQLQNKKRKMACKSSTYLKLADPRTYVPVRSKKIN